MRVDTALSRWFVVATVLGVGMVLCIGLFFSTAYAQTDSTDSSLDYIAPLVVTIEASESGAPDEAIVQAEFADIGVGIEEGSESIEIPDAEVSECVKTKENNKTKVKCKASKLKAGGNEVSALARDLAGNSSMRKGSIETRT
jgi:hypothetical protein